MPAFTLSSLLESRATRVVGLALAYWLTVVLAVELVTPVEKIALFWPPNAIVAAVSHTEYLEKSFAELTAKLKQGGAFTDVKSAYDPAAVNAAGFTLWRL